MTDLKNEFSAIKILESGSGKRDVKHGNCVSDKETRQHVKAAFHNYLSTNRPMPIRFFKEENRGLLLEEFRDQHGLYKHQLKKDPPINTSQSLTTALVPPVAEYYAERYGSLNDVVYKVNIIFSSVKKATENSSCPAVHGLSVTDPFKFANQEIIKDFDKFKSEITQAQELMNNTVNQMVRTHQSVAQICEDITQEARKRHESSQEGYSEDGSAIVVNHDEKYYLSQLNTKTDNFMAQKTSFLETLDKIIMLTCNLIVLKNRINSDIMEYYSSVVVPKQTNFETVMATHTLNDMVVINDANLDKIESYKMFKRFPQVETIPRRLDTKSDLIQIK